MTNHLAKTNSLVSNWIHELRNVSIQNDRLRFRRNLERIGEVMAYEISKTMAFTSTEVNTPLGIYNGNTLTHQPVIATIFRAGFPMFQGMLNYFDQADCAFIAAYRKHHHDGSFNIKQEYVTCPNIEGRTLIVADPMLATGASLIMAINELMEYGIPAALHIVVTIACVEGIDCVRQKYPEATIWAADIDEELTAKGYIVPGLGDAGDLSFGSKLQK